MVKSALADHSRNEPTSTRDVASVQRIVIRRPTTSLSHILASLPNEVEFAQAWPEFGRACPVMFEFGRHGQAIRWLFRTVYRCLLPRLRHGRSRSEHFASAFEGIVSMSDYAVAMDSRRDNGSDHRARTIIVASKHARKPGFACITLLCADPRCELIAQISKRCLLYTSPSPRDRQKSRMPSSA